MTDFSLSHENYRIILESISDAFFSLDDNLVVTYFNQAAEKVLNRQREDVLGRYLFDAFPEAGGSIFEEKYRFAIQKKAALTFEVYFPNPPYTNWYEVRVYPQEVGISVYFQVITERKILEAAIRQSEEKLSSLLEALNDALISVDYQTGEILHLNQATADLFGRPLEDLYAQPRFWEDAIHPEDRHLVATLKTDLLTADRKTLEYRIIRPDGSLRWLMDQAKLIRDEDDLPLRIDCLVSDITQRVETQSALKLARQRQETILETVSEGIIMVDTSGQILFANQAAEGILSLKKNEILGRYFQDHHWQQVDERLLPLPPEKLPLAIAMGKRKAVNAVEHGLLDQDGHLRWISVNAVPLTDEDQQLVGAVASFRDITRQKEDEHRIRFQAYLLDSVGQAAIAINLDNRVIYTNHYTEELLGYSPEELLGSLANETLVPLESHPIAERVIGIVKKGETWQGEINLMRKDGSTFAALATVTPIYEHQELNGYLAITIDITERKRTEETERQLRALSEALRDTAAALNSTLNFKEIFERILKNVGKVIAHQSANLMLVEDEDLYVALHQGYEDPESVSILENLHINKNDYPAIQWMIENRQALVIPETDISPIWKKDPGLDWVKSYAGLPLWNKGRVVGLLNLDSPIPGYFSLDDAFRLQAFADQAALAVENARLYQEVEQLSITDALTGVYNRRGLFTVCEEKISRAEQFHIPVALIVIDLDNFKYINDSFGHMIGDQVLAAVSNRLLNRMRPSDIVGRYGGDEFILLLMDIEEDGASSAAERLRQAIVLEPVQTVHEPMFVSVSMGLSTSQNSGYDFPTLLQHADRAMYKAKMSGKNRTVSNQGKDRYHRDR